MPSSLLQRIAVPFEYPVHFTHDCFDPASDVLVSVVARKEPARRHRVAAVLDQGLLEATPDLVRRLEAYVSRYASQLELVAAPVVAPGGEASKNDPSCAARVQSWLHELAFDRQSVLLVVGGGAVLDMAGYAAATTHRGVRLVRLPTTVLAQADSGVGVKNGINSFGKKNFLGTFAPPFGVINDVAFLETLPLRDRVAGMAEAVKVALVRDPRFFHWIAEHRAPLSRGELAPVSELIERSAKLHLAHIERGGDPFELGSARPLDFGHWTAHKLEGLSEHRLRHGECVAIGMAIDVLYGALTGVSPERVADATLGLLESLGFRLWDEALEMTGERGRPAVLEGLAEFREHLGGELSITLLRDLGAAFEVHAIEEDAVLRAMAALKRRAFA